jgi:threonine dehydrogenase-like Zn-dependent dehydrogenase
MEDFERRRDHAISHYLRLVSDGRLDITPMLTHRFRLEERCAALKSLERERHSIQLTALKRRRGPELLA